MVGVSVAPRETDSPLSINTNAVLAFPITLQRFQPVSRRNGQTFETNRGVQQLQLVKRLLLNIAWQLP
jgi:hypothetical protein